MKVHITLICFVFLTLRDENTGLIDAEIPVKEGGNVTVGCSFTIPGGRKIFCKEKCEEQDILVETTGDRAQSGRYSIEYKEGTSRVPHTLYVSITNLTKSDSGWYKCYLERYLNPNSSEEFEIRVEDAPIEGSSTPSSTSHEHTKQTQQQQITTDEGPGVILYVRLIVVVLIIVSSSALLIFCRKKTSKPKEPLVENDYANVIELSRVSEEIRKEDRQSRSPPVEISTVYSFH